MTPGSNKRSASFFVSLRRAAWIIFLVLAALFTVLTVVALAFDV